MLQVIPSTLGRIQVELQRDPRLQSEHTKRAYRVDLSAFEAWRGSRPLTKVLTEEYAAELQKCKSPKTVNRALCAIRWWARKISDLAYEGELESRDEIVLQAGRVASVRDVKGIRERRGRHIPEGEFASLLRECRGLVGIRDAAILVLAWSTGLRRSELSGLLLSDLHDEGDYWVFTVRGKGNKVRKAYLFDRSYLKAWLLKRGFDPGFLFNPIRKGDYIQSGRISDEGMASILNRRTKSLTWHDFRRTFIGNLLTDNDVVTVQNLAGHSSPRTTSNYDRRGDELKLKAVRNLSIPKVN